MLAQSWFLLGENDHGRWQLGNTRVGPDYSVTVAFYSLDLNLVWEMFLQPLFCAVCGSRCPAMSGRWCFSYLIHEALPV